LIFPENNRAAGDGKSQEKGEHAHQRPVSLLGEHLQASKFPWMAGNFKGLFMGSLLDWMMI